MIVLLADNFIIRWGCAIEWNNPSIEGDYSWYFKYDFHVLPIMAFRIFGPFGSLARCRGFAFILTSFSHVDYAWNTNFYHEERVNLRLGDHDLSSWRAIFKPTWDFLRQTVISYWAEE